MTLLSVVKDVCARVGVTVPSAVVPAVNANRTMQEMLTCANEMAQRIAYDTRGWGMLTETGTLVGDGTTIGFPLPANYKRLLLTSNVWRSNARQQPLRFIADPDEWLRRRSGVGETSSWGEWIIFGDNLRIYPPLAAGEQAQFLYLNKDCVALSSGGHGDAFLNDADRFRLDERLLKLGMIFDWKQNKGSPYAEDMGTWSDAMAIAMGADKPMPIMIDRYPISANARVAYPWPLPT